MKIEKEVDKLQKNVSEMQRICEKLQAAVQQQKFPDPSLLKKMQWLLLDSYYVNSCILPAIFHKEISWRNTPVPKEIAEILSVDEQHISLRLPFLPHKRCREDMILDILHSLLQQAMREGIQIPQMKKNTIHFTFVYSTAMGKAKVLDHDNYLTRGTINTLMLYIMSSDSGTNSWQTYRTILSDEMPPGTYITVEKRSEENQILTIK